MNNIKNIINISHVSFKYKDFSLKNISFSLEKGYIMGLVGKNGSGKTTIFNLLSGQMKNYTGDIEINGINAKTNRKYVMDNVCFISENQPFFMNKNSIENASMYSKYYAKWDNEKYEMMLKEFNIDKSLSLNKMSKGTFIKFQLAFGMAHNPVLYVMDEPTAGLDIDFRHQFLYMLQTSVESGEASVLFSTHITSDLDKIADYITIIDSGEIVSSKSIEQMRDEFYEQVENSAICQTTEKVFSIKNII